MVTVKVRERVGQEEDELRSIHGDALCDECEPGGREMMTNSTSSGQEPSLTLHLMRLIKHLAAVILAVLNST